MGTSTQYGQGYLDSRVSRLEQMKVRIEPRTVCDVSLFKRYMASSLPNDQIHE